MHEQSSTSKFEKIIPGVTGTNLTKADCSIHGQDVYFERVEGDLFRCANTEHKGQIRHRIDIVPGPGSHLHGV